MGVVGWQLAAQRAGADVAALVCDRAVPWPLSARLSGHLLLGGPRCAMLPRWQVRDVLLDTAPGLAPTVDEPLAPGQVWCVVLWHEDGRERCHAVPMRHESAATGGVA